ncbi:MAG: 50S ribosomal protein L31e [Candidatus Hadarchaeota archaeon]|nr:50S ribosomal protein L31e [Candidatus Hadarchaeota archaeon]
MPEERIYTIPLRKVKRARRYRRSSRAAKLVREFLQRHMKAEEVKLNEELNQELWKRGAERPMSRIRVRAVKQDDGSVEAFPAATRPKEEETSE